MISLLWKKIKNIPYLKEVIANLYYSFHKTRRDVKGNNNTIQLELQGKFSFIKNTLFEINGHGNTIIVKSGIRLFNTKIKIGGDRNTLILGEDCQISSGCLWIEGSECKLLIGEKTTIAQATIGAAETGSSVIIGKDCMLSHDIDIRSSDSHSIIDLTTNERINYAKDIHIEDRVWIAKGVQILKGVKIGSNSIIGIGSIVTKDIPGNCIAAGVPAEVKRTQVSWTRENIALKNPKEISNLLLINN